MKNLGDWGQARATVLLLTLCLVQQIHHSEGITLLVPEPVINATVTQNVLLSIDFTCNGTALIQWQFMSSWRSQCIIEWKMNSYVNISRGYSGRVHNYDNGSIQLLNVEVRDSGFYMITLTDDIGNIKQSTIILNVHEIRYEEFYFVAVFIAFLAAGSAVLVCLMWVCNKCINICQRRKQQRRAEEIELRIISD
ncbi:PREDICTED: V-set and transmembrane domain-containing protein 5 [Nanorana parkeri]|uniref:V-set and transmembrane domain-containing protein 5 n=1 Tax=Nanorana parkeri TaxID=125878 RepID=UPI000854E297|nr:PREDICTED: V-set and transmembrane domain-containing protein 5 [Nanorana parkeri]